MGVRTPSLRCTRFIRWIMEQVKEHFGCLRLIAADEGIAGGNVAFN